MPRWKMLHKKIDVLCFYQKRQCLLVSSMVFMCLVLSQLYHPWGIHLGLFFICV